MRKEFANWNEYQKTHEMIRIVRPESTRKEKRTAVMKVKHGGREKEMRVTDFLKQRAADLPKMTDKKTGKEIEHAANLKVIYMHEGPQGVDRYLASVRAVIRRDAGHKLHIRAWGWLTILWLKFRRLFS